MNRPHRTVRAIFRLPTLVDGSHEKGWSVVFEFHWFDARFFEMLFLICFAVSWPSSIVKSVRSKTAKGKSLVFLLFAFVGYLCGITSKLVDAQLSYTLFFYIFNCCLVGTDLVLYFVNTRRDRIRDAQAARDAARLAELSAAEAAGLSSPLRLREGDGERRA